ncbi:MAG: hypothetical protein K2X46_07665 [Roseomonas sp.]|nr:hypothetical protein [Roseomonas sp.]
MTDTPTAAQIAARLTPAQRKALLWLPGDGKCVRADGKTTPPLQEREFLRAMDLMAAPSLRFRRITPLGAEVRAILAQEARRDA